MNSKIAGDGGKAAIIPRALRRGGLSRQVTIDAPHPMNLLALETSTDRLSLALLVDGRLHAFDQAVGQRHAEMILEEVGALMRQAGIAPRDLQGVVYGEGPGAFTGLRIACGVAQGLA